VAGYEVLIKPSALAELDSADGRKFRRALAERIGALAAFPRPPGCSKLSGSDRYRVRCGRWRIIYSVDDDRRTVLVVKVGHRKDVYR
jgi:mRNA interferase RelE/StbE